MSVDLLINIINPETEIKTETEILMIWKLTTETVMEKIFKTVIQ